MTTVHDAVNSPAHYTQYKGLEVIDLTEQMNFCRGNAVKYIARAGAKDPSREVEDLEKARWYIDREIERVRAAEKPEPEPEPVGVLSWGGSMPVDPAVVQKFKDAVARGEVRHLSFEFRDQPRRSWLDALADWVDELFGGAR